MNQKVSAVLLAVFVCLIIWFAGWSIFNLARLDLYVAGSSFEGVLLLGEFAWVGVYGFVQVKASRKARQTSEPSIPEKTPERSKGAGGSAFKRIRVGLFSDRKAEEKSQEQEASEEIGAAESVGRGANPFLETFVSEPQKIDEPKQKPEQKLVESVKVSDDDIKNEEKRCDLSRLKLKVAAYERLTLEVRDGTLTVEAAQGLLTRTEPSENPLVLIRKEEQVSVKEERAIVPLPVKIEKKPLR